MASRLPYQPLPLKVTAGHILQRQDEHAYTAWEVLTGAFAERIRDADGRSLVLDLAGPGDITGCPPGRAARWEVQALCPASFRVWTGPLDNATNRWAERFSSLASDVAWLDVRTRLDRRLDDLAQRFGVPVPGGLRITLPLTHEGLAASVGVSRESVSRAMSDLRTAGRIRTHGRGRIVVVTPRHLVPEGRR